MEDIISVKYILPEFLQKKFDQGTYTRWLRRKAASHVKRDRNRNFKKVTLQTYMEAMHKAVKDSKGLDAYTGEKLDWSLIGTYNNKIAEVKGREIKIHFALLPTIDHEVVNNDEVRFKICSWRTNDAKNDLPYEEFVKLCKVVIKHYEKTKKTKG